MVLSRRHVAYFLFLVKSSWPSSSLGMMSRVYQGEYWVFVCSDSPFCSLASSPPSSPAHEYNAAVPPPALPQPVRIPRFSQALATPQMRPLVWVRHIRGYWGSVGLGDVWLASSMGGFWGGEVSCSIVLGRVEGWAVRHGTARVECPGSGLPRIVVCVPSY
jgi:hypothetical protein